jgi:HlyD family secretion protein
MRTIHWPQPPFWRHRTATIFAASAVLLCVAVWSSRLYSPSVIDVDVVSATAPISPADEGAFSAPGYIVAHHRINVNSKVTGRVAWVGIEKGDHAKEGQILVRLEDTEFQAQVQEAEGALANAQAFLQQLQAGPRPEEVKRAEHGLEQARISMLNDQAALDRTSKLVSEGVLPREALDNIRAKFGGSTEQMQYLEQSLDLVKNGPRVEELARARGSLVQAEGQLAFARSQLEATAIRAPIAGTILERTAEKGELVTAQYASGAEGGPQGSVVAIADLHDLRVSVDVPQTEFSRLHLGQKAVISVDAFSDHSYDGRIVEMSPEADRQKATVTVKVQIARPESRLRPQMNAVVKFLADPNRTKQPPAGAVLLPGTVVFDRNHQHWVVICANDVAHVREVQVLQQGPLGMLVLGVHTGDKIVLSSPQNLKDGDKLHER